MEKKYINHGAIKNLKKEAFSFQQSYQIDRNENETSNSSNESLLAVFATALRDAFLRRKLTRRKKDGKGQIPDYVVEHLGSATPERDVFGLFSHLSRLSYLCPQTSFGCTIDIYHLSRSKHIPLLHAKSITSDMPMTPPLWQKVKRN